MNTSRTYIQNPKSAVSNYHLKTLLRLLVLTFALSVRIQGAEPSSLEPNAILCFDFPELPSTLAKQPARLSAQLPENYSREGKFPICVYLDGGDGGRGDKQGIARRIVGPRDFICVNLPLFKRTNDGILVSVDDFETASHAYRMMLQKLFDAVPNISRERSAIGGFSNGAHTVGVLLAGQDEFILSHFNTFYFVDGGFGPLAANVLSKATMKSTRILLLRGEKPDDENADSKAERESNTHLALALELSARKHHLDFTSLSMSGFGHDFPPEYIALAGQWIRGEALSRPNTPKTVNESVNKQQ
jgi:hypothetical protein